MCVCVCKYTKFGKLMSRNGPEANKFARSAFTAKTRVKYTIINARVPSNPWIPFQGIKRRQLYYTGIILVYLFIITVYVFLSSPHATPMLRTSSRYLCFFTFSDHLGHRFFYILCTRKDLLIESYYIPVLYVETKTF